MKTALPETRFSTFFKDYASYHRTSGNQICHYLGIPMIVLSILGLTSHLIIAGGLTGSEFIRLDVGILIWAASMIWYLVLNWRLAVPFALVSLGLYLIGRTVPLPALWTLFVGGWIIQFVGHYVFEKKSPAFYKNGQHLLVGPLWIFSKLIDYKR